MIHKISGHLVEKTDNSLIINVGGIFYEILVPLSVLQRADEHLADDNKIELITFHYLQMGPAAGYPVLVGFFNSIERDFFLQFIKVSGIGPRAAVKALNKPISEISHAINEGDAAFLKTLPGIGMQRAKEIVAKLQGRVGKYGLIRDKAEKASPEPEAPPDWQQEALAVILQLQYRKPEAQEMIRKALERKKDLSSTEELLNEIYKQRIQR